MQYEEQKILSIARYEHAVECLVATKSLIECES